MKIKHIKEYLDNYDDEDNAKFWINVDGHMYSSPNMATITSDELFKLEDRLSSFRCSSKPVSNDTTTIFNFCWDMLDTLESKLLLDPEFVAEMENMREKGELDDFVEWKMPDISLWDKINFLSEAETIQDYIDASNMVLSHMQKIKNAYCYLTNTNIVIKPIGNTSMSTSIIADTLGIDAKEIDDRYWFSAVWKIPIKKR